MGVEKFEDLVAWQKARKLTKSIYQVTNNGPFAKDYGLRDQIRRAAVSIMSNIAEGFGRGTINEFHQYLVIAKGSCAEVRSQLYVAYDVGYLEKTVFEDLELQAHEVSKVLSGLRSSIAKQRTRPSELRTQN
ncbi:four helix bundle protein [Prosthecochloris sp. HL-130-GSB]|uniref:four helix bundle protein n=1 Tax=Prosthecochloris sp. HL-130-GSB TaxID=1974213 RepID=UPI000A1C08A3|nr:four helix bundle protein [Prosthecochloris sp. HL-130-GSB]ARM31372.1 four helix bundle protein [Prosthecochloris sp. HL-130-GSB]